MKRTTILKRRAENYKKCKIVKALVGGGFPKAIAECMGKCASEARSFATVLEHDSTKPLLLSKATTKTALWVRLCEAIDGGFSMLAAQASKMEGAMKNNAIMKPITLPGLQPKDELDDVGKADCAGFDLEVPPSHPAARPWLLVIDNHVWCNGMLRWPFMGMPAILVAITSPLTIAVVPLENIFLKGHSLDNMKDHYDDEAADTSDVMLYSLQAGEGLFVPFGMAIFCAPLPADEKQPRSKVMVMNLFCTCQAKNASGIVRHQLANAWQHHFGGKGQEPWKPMQATFESWIPKWQAAPAS